MSRRNRSMDLSGMDWTKDSMQNGSELDRCVFCLGGKGGRHGEEILVGSAWLCQECHDTYQCLVQQTRETPEVEDAAEVGDLIRSTTTTAMEHMRAEARGELVSLVTPVGGTVTDPDELQMYQALKEANISVCAHCYSTGWWRNLARSITCCPCPYGVFLSKRTGHPLSMIW